MNSEKSSIHFTMLKHRLIGSAVLSTVIVVLSINSVISAKPVIPENVFNPVLFCLTLPILFWTGRSVFSTASKQLILGRMGIHFLAAMGAGAAMITASAVTWIPGLHALPDEHIFVYFNSAAMTITLMILGFTIEAAAQKQGASWLVKLNPVNPANAHLKTGETIADIPVETIKPGMILQIKPGEIIPVDGKITAGHTTIDVSMMTDNTLPVEKVCGDRIIGGTLNLTNLVEIKTTGSSETTAGSQMIRLAHDFVNRRKKSPQLTDRFTSKIIPAVMILALLTFIYYATATASTGWIEAVFRMLIFLILSAPWVLGLASPAIVASGTNIAVEHGMLIKPSGRFETAHGIDTIVFDKTGILTMGEVQVIQTAHGTDITENQLIRLAASAVQHSGHPLAKAIHNAARSRSLLLEPVTGFHAAPGFGISTRWKNHLLRVGSRAFTDTLDITVNHFQNTITHWQKLGHSIVIVVLDSSVLGLLAVQDPIRPEIFQVIQQFRQSGISTALLSSDKAAVAEQIGRQIGIDRIYGEVAAEQRYQIIRDLQMEGRSVAVVGDGINDAPALAAAELSIALGGDCESVLDIADIVLVNKTLGRVAEALTFSKRLTSAIKMNLFWIFIFNFMGQAAAAGILPLITGMHIQSSHIVLIMTLGTIMMSINIFHYQYTSKSLFNRSNAA